MKKVISFVLTIAMLLCALPMQVIALDAPSSPAANHVFTNTLVHMGREDGEIVIDNDNPFDSEQDDWIKTQIGNYIPLVFYCDGQPISPASVRICDINGDDSNIANISYATTYAYTDNNEYTIYEMRSTNLGSGFIEIEYDCEGTILTGRISLEVVLPKIGLYSNPEVDSEYYLGNDILYSGEELVIYAVIKAPYNFVFASSDVQMESIGIDLKNINVEKISDSALKITVKDNIVISHNVCGFEVAVPLHNDDGYWDIKNIDIYLEDARVSTDLYVNQIDATPDGNIVERNSKESLISRQSGNTFAFQFYTKTSNNYEPVVFDSIAYYSDIQYDANEIVVSKMPGTSYYSISFSDVGSGRIVGIKDGELFSINIVSKSKDVDKYFSPVANNSNLLYEDGSMFYVGDQPNNEFYIISSDEYEIKSYRWPDPDNQNNSAFCISKYSDNTLKVEIDSSKLTQYEEQFHLLVELEDEFENKSSKIVGCLIRDLSFVTPDMEDYKNETPIVGKHEISEDDYMNEAELEVFSNQKWNCQFEYQGNWYIFCVASANMNDANVWINFPKSGDTTNMSATRQLVFAPGVYKQVNDTWIPVDDSVMEDLKTKYEFTISMKATRAEDVTDFNVNESRGRVNAIYQYTGSAITWASQAIAVRMDKDMLGCWALIATMAEKTNPQNKSYACAWYSHSLTDIAEYYIKSDASDIDGINAEIEEISRIDYDFTTSLWIYLPAGTITGNIVLPEEFEKHNVDCISIIGNNVLQKNSTIINGGIRSYMHNCQTHLSYIDFVGKGKTVSTDNVCLIGVDQIIPYKCSFTGYDTVHFGNGNLALGGNETKFFDNRIVIYINQNNPGGGDHNMVDCTFENNDIAIWYENGADKDFTFTNVRFVNNRIDVINRSGETVWLNGCFFYHGPVNGEGYPTKTYSTATEDYFLPVLIGCNDWVPMTITTTLAKDYDFQDGEFIPSNGYGSIMVRLQGFLEYRNNTDNIQPGQLHGNLDWISLLPDGTNPYAYQSIAWHGPVVIVKGTSYIPSSLIEGFGGWYIDENGNFKYAFKFNKSGQSGIQLLKKPSKAW